MIRLTSNKGNMTTEDVESDQVDSLVGQEDLFDLFGRISSLPSL